MADDGVGIETEKLTALQKSIIASQQDDYTAPTTEGSIGLANIARRLYLFYGQDSHLILESIEGKGTTVKVTIPIQRGGKVCTE